MFQLRKKTKPADSFLPKDESKLFFGFNVENNFNPLTGAPSQMEVIFRDGNPLNQKASNIMIVPTYLKKEILRRLGLGK